MADKPPGSGEEGTTGIVIGFGLWILGAILLGAVTGKMGLCLSVGILLGLCLGGVTWMRGSRSRPPRQDAEPSAPAPSRTSTSRDV